MSTLRQTCRSCGFEKSAASSCVGGYSADVDQRVIMVGAPSLFAMTSQLRSPTPRHRCVTPATIGCAPNKGEVHAREGQQGIVQGVEYECARRLPHNETLRPYGVQLMKTALHVLNSDNEENGLLCLRICFDLHKAYRPTLEDQVPPFLDFVRKV